MTLLFGMTGAYGVPGGIATANRNTLRALLQLSETSSLPLVVLSLHEGEEARPAFLPDGVRFRGFRGQRASFSLALAAGSLRARLVCLDHVTLGRPLLPLVRWGLARTAIFAHGSESWKRVRRSSIRGFQASALTLTNSEYTLRKMRERFDGFEATVCALGLSPDVPLNQAVPAPSTEPLRLTAADGATRRIGSRALLLVGRMHPAEREKGHRQLIDALPRLQASFPDAQLVFPGPGDDRSALLEYARAGGVAPAVFLPGFVPDAELWRLYHASYALVMPSRQEGFGLVYLEAMNWGKPCVGCFDDGAEAVIRHGETGWLVRNPSDRDELLDVLRRLLADPARAAAMGRAGFRRLHERFTAEHAQARIRESLRGVLA